MIKDIINAEYLYTKTGSEMSLPGRNNNCSNVGDISIYKIEKEYDGKQYIILVTLVREIILPYNKFTLPDLEDTHKVLEIVDCIPLDEYEYNPSLKEQSNSTESDKSEDEIDLSAITISLNLPNDLKNFPNENIIANRFLEELIQRKKKLIEDSRQEGFDRWIKDNPDETIEKVINKLDNPQKQAKARNLYDRMIKSLMMGRYKISDYQLFIKSLEDVVNGQGLFVPEEFFSRFLP